MAGPFSGVQIYAIMPARDIRAYLERHASQDGPVDIEASLQACEQGIHKRLSDAYPGSRILVRRQDHPTPEPPRTRVEASVDGVDTGEIEQEVADLVAEFDFTQCVVYR
jgi:hypothetical protein